MCHWIPQRQDSPPTAVKSPLSKASPTTPVKPLKAGTCFSVCTEAMVHTVMFRDVKPAERNFCLHRYRWIDRYIHTYRIIAFCDSVCAVSLSFFIMLTCKLQFSWTLLLPYLGCTSVVTCWYTLVVVGYNKNKKNQNKNIQSTFLIASWHAWCGMKDLLRTLFTTNLFV